jgi:hypothetical protein
LRCGFYSEVYFFTPICRIAVRLLLRGLFLSEASHVALPSKQLEEACSEAVIKDYHQGSVIRRAVHAGFANSGAIGSMLTGPEGRRRAIVRAASASVGNGSASFFSPQATVGNLRVSQTECPPG